MMIPRESYSRWLDEFREKKVVKVLTGLRRSGKSTILELYVQKLRKEGAAPPRLYTDDPRTEAFLSDFCGRMGIILERKRTRIPMLSQACERLFRMNDMPLPRDKNN